MKFFLSKRLSLLVTRNSVTIVCTSFFHTYSRMYRKQHSTRIEKSVFFDLAAKIVADNLLYIRRADDYSFEATNDDEYNYVEYFLREERQQLAAQLEDMKAWANRV